MREPLQLKVVVKKIREQSVAVGVRKMKKLMKSQPLSQASITVLNPWLLSMGVLWEMMAARPKVPPLLMYLNQLKILNQHQII